MNRRQEKDTNMVHRPGKEQDTAHRRVPCTVTDMVPGMATGIGKEHRLDMVPGLTKASELAPAPAPNKYTPLTAGRLVVCYLKDILLCCPWYLTKHC